MKILMLIDKMESGGAETHVESLTRALCELGNRVEIFSAGGRIADRMEHCGITQWRIPFIGRSPTRFLYARQMLRKIVTRGDYDILHVHTRTMALLAQGIKGKRGKGGSVVTAHAAFSTYPRLSKIAFRAEKTIAVSEDIRKRCIDMFEIPAESITVIPNGVDCEIFQPSEAVPESESILFASRLDEDCALGARLLCELAPRLIEDFPHLRISIAGGGNAREDIKKSTAQANKKCRKIAGCDAITMLGTVDDMAQAYRAHRIFVGVSRAAMEAAACGCAVILCGNEGRGGILSLERIAADTDNLCCRGEALPDAAWLEEELLQLLKNERRSALLAEYGRAWVCKCRCIREIAHQTREVYCAVAGEKGGAV